MGISKNWGTPKSFLIGFSTINHPFSGTPVSLFLETPINPKQPGALFSFLIWEHLFFWSILFRWSKTTYLFGPSCLLPSWSHAVGWSFECSGFPCGEEVDEHVPKFTLGEVFHCSLKPYNLPLDEHGLPNACHFFATFPSYPCKKEMGEQEFSNNGGS